MISNETPQGSEMPSTLVASLVAKDGEELLSELMQLEQLPQARLVASSVFDRATPPGSKGQLRGVGCKLRCCKRYIDQKCNEIPEGIDGSCNTHSVAARLLHAKILEKHGSEACLAAAREALHLEMQERVSLQDNLGCLPVTNAFSEMLGKQIAIQRAQLAVKLSREREEAAVRHQHEANAEREAASLALEEAS